MRKGAISIQRAKLPRVSSTLLRELEISSGEMPQVSCPPFLRYTTASEFHYSTRQTASEAPWDFFASS